MPTGEQGSVDRSPLVCDWHALQHFIEANGHSGWLPVACDGSGAPAVAQQGAYVARFQHEPRSLGKMLALSVSALALLVAAAVIIALTVRGLDRGTRFVKLGLEESHEADGEGARRIDHRHNGSSGGRGRRSQQPPHESARRSSRGRAGASRSGLRGGLGVNFDRGCCVERHAEMAPLDVGAHEIASPPGSPSAEDGTACSMYNSCRCGGTWSDPRRAGAAACGDSSQATSPVAPPHVRRSTLEAGRVRPSSALELAPVGAVSFPVVMDD